MSAAITVRLQARREAARQARRALADLTLASAQLADLSLLVSELVSGCAVHCDEGADEIELRVAVARHVVRAEVVGHIGADFSSTKHLHDGRRSLFDRLTERWGLIDRGRGGGWIELRRDLVGEFKEQAEARRRRSATLHEQSAAMHRRAARFHGELAAAWRARGEVERADAEAARAQAARKRSESERFRMRRALARA
jgi:hypothetical protein